MASTPTSTITPGRAALLTSFAAAAPMVLLMAPKLSFGSVKHYGLIRDLSPSVALIGCLTSAVHIRNMWHGMHTFSSITFPSIVSRPLGGLRVMDILSHEAMIAFRMGMSIGHLWSDAIEFGDGGFTAGWRAPWMGCTVGGLTGWTTLHAIIALGGGHHLARGAGAVFGIFSGLGAMIDALVMPHHTREEQVLGPIPWNPQGALFAGAATASAGWIVSLILKGCQDSPVLASSVGYAAVMASATWMVMGPHIFRLWYPHKIAKKRKEPKEEDKRRLAIAVQRSISGSPAVAICHVLGTCAHIISWYSSEKHLENPFVQPTPMDGVLWAAVWLPQMAVSVLWVVDGIIRGMKWLESQPKGEEF